MRKLTILLILLISVRLYGLNRLGPPVSELKKGQSSIGFEFSHNNENLKYSYSDYSVDSKETIDLYMSNIGFGINDNSDLHFKIGANNAENAQTGFAWAVSSKNTLSENNHLKLGLVTQVTGIYQKEYGIIYIPPYVISIEDNIQAYEYQLGFGPCLDYNDISFYAYPFFHYIYGEDDFGIDIRNTDDFGGCAGLVLKPDNNLNINIEGQFAGDSYSIGLGFCFKFGKSTPTTPPARQEKEIPLSEKIDSSKTLKGYQIKTDKYGQKTKIPVYEDEK